jgi:hypothetical protein
MSLQEVYKYCRPWAIAQEPPEREGALTPVAPYAVDVCNDVDTSSGRKRWGLNSTSRASYNLGWSKEYKRKTHMTNAAGGGASDREPHDSMEARRCIQHNTVHGGRTDYKEEMSLYQQATEPKALARHHRHCEQARQLPHNVREARWYKCFRQWEGQWEHREDSQTRVTGTDFSVLPAGYVPKNGHLPQRHILERYGRKSDNGDDDQAAQPSNRKVSSKVGGSVLEVQKPKVSKAWATKAVVDTEEQGKLVGGRQKGFRAWAKAAKQRSGRTNLKGAEYMKAPIPTWVKEVPGKLRQADLLAALKPKEKGNTKYFNDHDTVPLEEIFR